MTLNQFNPGKKSWKIYGNTLTSISGDDLTLLPYVNQNLVLETSGNGNIIFKEDGKTYTIADLSNAISNLDLSSTTITINSDISYNITQSGDDIYGDAEHDYDQFGYTVALSSDGTIVAITAWQDRDGEVRVFEYNDSDNSWNKKGQYLEESTQDNKSKIGESLSLSSNGDILAVGMPTGGGRVKVFQYTDPSWIQLGQTIDGRAGTTDLFGNSVSLSSNGHTIAIGAQHYGSNKIGSVQIFQYTHPSWIQLGNTIFGETSKEYFGQCVSLSSEGTIVAIGAKYYLNNDTSHAFRSGRVKIYKYNATDSLWNPLGQTINGETERDFLGTSISLSSNGYTIAISAYNYSNEKGSVQIFQYNDPSWIQLGQRISGETTKDHYGHHVSLSSDGTIVAFSYALYKEDQKGRVRIYKYNATDKLWIQIGHVLYGKDNRDHFGISMALSSDGTKIAAGSYSNNSNTGYVQIYDIISEQVPINAVACNALVISEKLIVSGDVNITGNLDVIGATDINSTLNVTDATTLQDLSAGATDISNTLNVTGATTLNSTLNVTGITNLSTTNISHLYHSGMVIHTKGHETYQNSVMKGFSKINISGNGDWHDLAYFYPSGLKDGTNFIGCKVHWATGQTSFGIPHGSGEAHGYMYVDSNNSSNYHNGVLTKTNTVGLVSVLSLRVIYQNSHLVFQAKSSYSDRWNITGTCHLNAAFTPSFI